MNKPGTIRVVNKDMDNDGDEDIILSSFAYPFTPAPTDLAKFWIEENVDLMVLENILKQ